MRRFSVLPLCYFNKRLLCSNITDLPESKAKYQLKHVDVIKEFTGCPIDQVRRAVSSKLELQLLSEEEVLHKLKLLEGFDFYDFRSVNIVPLLLKHPLALKNHHGALCEYSFTPYLIQSYQIKRFTNMSRNSVKDMKEKGYIESSADVMRNLWRHAELDMNNCPEVSDLHTLRDLKALAIRGFFKEKLGVSDEDIDRQLSEINLRLIHKNFQTMHANCYKYKKALAIRGFFKKKLGVYDEDIDRQLSEINLRLIHKNFQTMHANCYKYKKALAIRGFFKEKLGVSDEDIDRQLSEINLRLIHKSFQTMNANLRLFRDVIKLSKTRIFLNWYILFTNYENTLEILSKFPYIGSTDVRVIFHIFPKISSMTADNMEKILKYLEEEGIPITSLEKQPVLLTLSCETVKRRLIEMKNNEALSVYQKHPLIARLLLQQVKAKRRLNILQELKVLCTMHYLVTTDKDFERICESHSRASGSDSLHYLKAELNLDQSEIKFKLRRHKRWRYVPVVEVAKNLHYLRKQFSDKEIIDNLCILFYYNGRLLQELEKLEHLENMGEFMCDGQIKKEFILPLTIYFLEKEFNFTGESVWDTSITDPYQDLPDKPEIKVNSL